MRRIFLSILCASCAATTPPTKEPVAVAPPAPLPTIAKKPDWSGLRAKLDQTKVTGLAMVDRAVVLSPTKDVTKPREKLSGGVYVTVIEDDGPAIRVRTAAPAELAEIDTAYDLEGYIPRGALVPVLARPITKNNADGTGFVLREGLELALGDRIAPANGLLSKLPTNLSAEDVTLGFALVDTAPALAKAGGRELGCARGDTGGTRVDDPDTLRRERIDQWRNAHPNASEFESPYGFGFGGRGFHDFPCHVSSGYDYEATRKDATLEVGGVSLGKAAALAYSDGDFEEVHRASGTKVLVTFKEPRAIVRALTDESVLGWGGGGAGFGGGARPKVWSVAGPAVAYYADGTKAGVHKGARPTKMRGAHEVNGRMCFRLGWVSVEICHDKSDLKEIEDTPW